MLAGAGSLKFPGWEGEVDYRISVRAASARVVPPGERGAVELPPETARESFRAGSATLKLEDGRTCRISVIAHTEGARTAYFQTLA